MKFKTGDWICSNCQDHQFSKNTKCRNCGFSKGGTVNENLKPGDWLCPTCKTHQFAFRLTCRDCNTSKNYEGENKEIRLNKDYYLVLDFEANCSKQDARDHEIIEFPAVLVNAKTGVTINEFRSFVKLVSHKKLSKFIKELTHITDEQVNQGLEWKTCLFEFEKWCISNNISSENTTVVTCGDWDLKTMLKNQLYMTKTKLSPLLKELFGCWTNVKIPFSKYTGSKAKGMANQLKYLGIPLSGHHHSGIDDCRNIAKICHELTKLGCDITSPTFFSDKKY